VVVLQEGSDGAARRCRNATGGALTRSSSRCYNCIFFMLQILCGSATLV
jgi:hypothetical protein